MPPSIKLNHIIEEDYGSTKGKEVAVPTTTSMEPLPHHHHDDNTISSGSTVVVPFDDDEKEEYSNRNHGMDANNAMVGDDDLAPIAINAAREPSSGTSVADDSGVENACHEFLDELIEERTPEEEREAEAQQEGAPPQDTRRVCFSSHVSVSEAPSPLELLLEDYYSYRPHRPSFPRMNPFAILWFSRPELKGILKQAKTLGRRAWRRRQQQGGDKAAGAQMLRRLEEEECREDSTGESSRGIVECRTDTQRVKKRVETRKYILKAARDCLAKSNASSSRASGTSSSSEDELSNLSSKATEWARDLALEEAARDFWRANRRPAAMSISPIRAPSRAPATRRKLGQGESKKRKSREEDAPAPSFPFQEQTKKHRGVMPPSHPSPELPPMKRQVTVGTAAAMAPQRRAASQQYQFDRPEVDFARSVSAPHPRADMHPFPEPPRGMERGQAPRRVSSQERRQQVTFAAREEDTKMYYQHECHAHDYSQHQEPLDNGDQQFFDDEPIPLNLPGRDERYQNHHEYEHHHIRHSSEEHEEYLPPEPAAATHHEEEDERQRNGSPFVDLLM